MVWGEEAAKLKLHCTLAWHHVVASTDSSQTSTVPSQLASSHQSRQTSISVSPASPQSRTQQIQPPLINIQRGGVIFSPPASLDDQACPGFNMGTCFDNASHPSLLHVCTYCLQTVRKHGYHTEMYCQCKGATQHKMGRWGGGSKPDLTHGYCRA